MAKPKEDSWTKMAEEHGLTEQKRAKGTFELADDTFEVDTDDIFSKKGAATWLGGAVGRAMYGGDKDLPVGDIKKAVDESGIKPYDTSYKGRREREKRDLKAADDARKHRAEMEARVAEATRRAHYEKTGQKITAEEAKALPSYADMLKAEGDKEFAEGEAMALASGRQYNKKIKDHLYAPLRRFDPLRRAANQSQRDAVAGMAASMSEGHREAMRIYEGTRIAHDDSAEREYDILTKAAEQSEKDIQGLEAFSSEIRKDLERQAAMPAATQKEVIQSSSVGFRVMAVLGTVLMGLGGQNGLGALGDLIDDMVRDVKTEYDKLGSDIDRKESKFFAHSNALYQKYAQMTGSTLAAESGLKKNLLQSMALMANQIAEQTGSEMALLQAKKLGAELAKASGEEDFKYEVELSKHDKPVRTVKRYLHNKQERSAMMAVAKEKMKLGVQKHTLAAKMTVEEMKMIAENDQRAAEKAADHAFEWKKQMKFNPNAPSNKAQKLAQRTGKAFAAREAMQKLNEFVAQHGTFNENLISGYNPFDNIGHGIAQMQGDRNLMQEYEALKRVAVDALVRFESGAVVGEEEVQGMIDNISNGQFWAFGNEAQAHAMQRTTDIVIGKLNDEIHYHAASVGKEAVGFMEGYEGDSNMEALGTFTEQRDSTGGDVLYDMIGEE